MTNLDYPSHRRILGAGIIPLHRIMDQRIHLPRTQIMQVRENLQRRTPMALSRIAQLVRQDRTQHRRLRSNHLRLLLQLQALDEVAQGGEARGDQGRRRRRRSRNADTFEDGGLALLGDAIVFYAGLEGCEEGEALVWGL